MTASLSVRPIRTTAGKSLPAMKPTGRHAANEMTRAAVTGTISPGEAANSRGTSLIARTVGGRSPASHMKSTGAVAEFLRRPPHQAPKATATNQPNNDVPRNSSLPFNDATISRNRSTCPPVAPRPRRRAFFFIIEPPGDFAPAGWAASLYYGVSQDLEAPPFDQHRIAPGTTCGFRRVPGQVAEVDEIESFGSADAQGGFESRSWGRWKALQQVIGLKARVVQRNVGAEVDLDPAGKIAEVFVGVVESRHHQIDDFQPDSRRSYLHKCVKHRFQLAANYVRVIVFTN